MQAIQQSIQEAVASKDMSSLASILDDSWSSLGQGDQKTLASETIQSFVADASLIPEISQAPEIDQVMNVLLHNLPPKVPDAADSTLRQRLYDALTTSSDPDYTGAARYLSGMRMSDDPESIYYVAPVQKAELYVQMAECFLADDETAESDAAVQKAGAAVEHIDKTKHSALILRYKSTTARVLDANRKFLAAASRYHELSMTQNELIDQDDLLQLLGRAATCAILAPSGPQRERVLDHLVNDERLDALDSIEEYATHATIVRKMVRKQILKPNEWSLLQKSLADHQKAVMGDGLTILERGVVQHNMVAVSMAYRSIYIKDLATLLGVSDKKAEQLAADMILDGSLEGSMDEVDGLLFFEEKQTPVQAWDANLMKFCQELNKVSSQIKEAVSTA